MISPDEALRLILERVPLLPEEQAELGKAVGLVLSRDIESREDLPPFDNSAMDGFAVRAGDCAGASPASPAVLAVKETLRAGKLATARVEAGEAAKIMTGAPLPEGADAVVMREFAEIDPQGRVRILRAPKPGDHVRERGEDVRRGEKILEKGIKIRPYEIALLAAQGFARVPAFKRPRVGVMATGDELLDAAAAPAPGKIRNSNGPALSAALSRWGASVADLGIVEDDPRSLREALRKGADSADMIIVTGGVSVGDFDYTKGVLEDLGLEVVFWKVAIKPGKPLLFGLWGGKPVFGLPGNPVSAIVCLEEFVRPAVEKMQGCAPRHPGYHLIGRLVNEYPKPADRRQYLFCQVSEDAGAFELRVIRPQGSAMLGMASKADALAIAPIGVSRLKPGDELQFRWLK